MLQQDDTGIDWAAQVWSVASMVARTGGTFPLLRVELVTVLGREPTLAETLGACAIGQSVMSSPSMEADDAALGAWMMLSRLAGRLSEAA